MRKKLNFFYCCIGLLVSNFVSAQIDIDTTNIKNVKWQDGRLEKGNFRILEMSEIKKTETFTLKDMQ